MMLRRVARPLLGAIFVWGGVNALRHLEGHAKVAKPLLDKASDKLPDQVPTEPAEAVRLDGLIKIGAGLALGAGFLPRLAALALAGSLVPTTLAAHRFWEIKDPAERSAQQVHFLKNLGLLGGLLLASADTEGKPSLGWRARHAAHDMSEAVKDATGTVRDKVEDLIPG